MNDSGKQQLKMYVDLALRYRVLIVSCLFLSLLAGLVVFYKTPRAYQATTLLIYQTQKINPGSKMSPDIEAKTKEIVSTLMQQVTSRTNLDAIIKEADLYADLRQELPLEDVIEVMRRQIFISPTQGDIFKVEFMGEDPRKVLKVVNALSAKFIEENLKYREEKASATSSYVADELALAKTSLDKKESLIRDYKLKYYNELPEQRELNVARLNTLQVKLQGVQDNIQQLTGTRALLQEQISQRGRQATSTVGTENASGQGGMSGGSHPGEAMDGYQRLAAMQAQLDLLRSQYKDNHPQIKRMKGLIAELEKSLGETPPEEGGSGAKTSSVGRDPVIAELQLQKNTLDATIIAKNREVDSLRQQINQLEEWIAAAPVREAEYSSLTRDYEELKRHYDFLVAQNLQAESVENLERQQKGSQFKIIDPARLPEKPVKPDLMKIMAMALGVGLGLGGGLAFLLGLMDSSFRAPHEIEDLLGVPVVSSVPFLPIAREKRRQTLTTVGWYIFLASGVLVLSAAVLFLWRKGMLLF